MQSNSCKKNVLFVILFDICIIKGCNAMRARLHSCEVTYYLQASYSDCCRDIQSSDLISLIACRLSVKHQQTERFSELFV